MTMESIDNPDANDDCCCCGGAWWPVREAADGSLPCEEERRATLFPASEETRKAGFRSCPLPRSEKKPVRVRSFPWSLLDPEMRGGNLL